METVVEPWLDAPYSNGGYVRQKDSAPAHKVTSARISGIKICLRFDPGACGPPRPLTYRRLTTPSGAKWNTRPASSDSPLSMS